MKYQILEQYLKFWIEYQNIYCIEVPLECQTLSQQHTFAEELHLFAAPYQGECTVSLSYIPSWLHLEQPSQSKKLAATHIQARAPNHHSTVKETGKTISQPEQLSQAI